MALFVRNNSSAFFALVAAYNAKQRTDARGDTSSGLFADGSDGAATMDGTSTVTGASSLSLAPTNGIYTATRDLNWSTLQVNPGVVLNMAGFKLFGATQIQNGLATAATTAIASGSNNQALPQSTINVGSTTGFPTAGAAMVVIGGVQCVFLYTGGGGGGTSFTGCTMLSGSPVGTLLTNQVVTAWAVIHNVGNAGLVGTAGTGGAAGAISAAGSTAQGTAGGAGGSGNNVGAGGTNQTSGFPGGTGVGGAGGAATNAGGAAGTWAALVATKGGARHLFNLVMGGCFGTSAWSPFAGGSGGGGGAGDNADAGGGGGGGGGGVLIIAAWNLINYGGMYANGGTGGPGFSTSHDAGGGGGGGGGVAITVSRTRSGTGSVTAAGGPGGAKVGTGSVGNPGTAGVVLQTGVAGYFHFDQTPGIFPSEVNWETPVVVPALQISAAAPTTLVQVVALAEQIRAVLLTHMADAPNVGLAVSPGGAHAVADTTNNSAIQYWSLAPLLAPAAGTPLPSSVLGTGATYAAVTAGHQLVVNFGGGQPNVTFTFAGTEATQAAFLAVLNNAEVPQLATSAIPSRGPMPIGLALNSGGQTLLVATNPTGTPAVIVSGNSDVLASLGLAVGAFTPVATVTQPATQTQANALLNALQTALNAHLTQLQSATACHVQNDNSNTSSAAAASSLGTSETLASNLQACINAHILSAAPDPLVRVMT
jgi:hypothetical protein